MKVAFRMVMVAALASLVSLTASCAESGGPALLVGPEAPAMRAVSTTDGVVERPSLERLARFRTKPQVTVAWAKKWIGPEGGRLDFQGFAVEVPAGAVSKVTKFSIRLPVDPQGSEHVVAVFGPHGSTFQVPVTIEFPLRGTSIEASPYATVVWWDGSQKAWVDMGGAPTADGVRLRTTTTHFSEYGTTDTTERGGTVVASGG